MSDQEPKSELKIGQMPQPHWFQMERDNGKLEPSIGIEAYTPNGDIKTFIYWRGFPANLSLPDDRMYLAYQLAELTLRMDTLFAVGPNVFVSKSDAQTGRIDVDKDPYHVGLYVETGKRLLVNHMSQEQFDKRLDLKELEATFTKISKVMPTNPQDSQD